METNCRRKLQSDQRKAESLFNIFGRTILSKPKRCDILVGADVATEQVSAGQS